MSSLYLQKGQYDNALSAAERGVALNPNGADARFTLAAIVGQLGRWEESVLYAKKAIRLNPFPMIYYYFALGHAYFMTGQYDESIATFKKMLNRSPDNIYAQVFLAASYSLAGRNIDAAAAAKEVLRLNPKFSLASQAKV